MSYEFESPEVFFACCLIDYIEGTPAHIGGLCRYLKDRAIPLTHLEFPLHPYDLVDTARYILPGPLSYKEGPYIKGKKGFTLLRRQLAKEILSLLERGILTWDSDGTWTTTAEPCHPF